MGWSSPDTCLALRWMTINFIFFLNFNCRVQKKRVDKSGLGRAIINRRNKAAKIAADPTLVSSNSDVLGPMEPSPTKSKKTYIHLFSILPKLNQDYDQSHKRMIWTNSWLPLNWLERTLQLVRTTSSSTSKKMLTLSCANQNVKISRSWRILRWLQRRTIHICCHRRRNDRWDWSRKIIGNGYKYLDDLLGLERRPYWSWRSQNVILS